MPSVTFCLSSELQVFIHPRQRGDHFSLSFEGNPSIKHLLEALGIPHTEIQRIQINGLPLSFAYQAQDGNVIQVWGLSPSYPAKEGDIQVLSDNDYRFLLDNHLGRLAAYLRLLGFDTLYRNDYQDQELAQIAFKEDRILLTRDHQLLMRNLIHRGYWLRSQKPREQVVEIIEHYQLIAAIKPFQRCLSCNGILQPVIKEAIQERLLPKTRRYYDEFHICQTCQQIFWKGSHYQRMVGFIENMINKESQE